MDDYNTILNVSSNGHSEMNENEILDLVASIECILVEMHQELNSLDYVAYNFDGNICKEIYKNFEHAIDYNDYQEIYNKYIEQIYIENGIIKRSYRLKESIQYFNDIHTSNQEQIDYLINIPQPEQRTPEWYRFRYDHITGSNAWKIFSTTKSPLKQIYYEKIAPFINHSNNEGSLTSKPSNMSNTPLNWGHKYEPLTTMMYEYFNNVKVDEFGCIPHKTIPFLAASPDGIVTSERLNGRMLEIKNVVSREITGIPKMEYYIQMQIQMEVCDLDECDFVETKFVEYDSYMDFVEDNTNTDKGMICVIMHRTESPYFIYEYAPLFQNTDEDLDTFTKQTFKKYNITEGDTAQDGKYTWVKNIYWKMDVYSDVLVVRNRKWFNDAYPILKDFWDVVLSERNIEGAYLKYQPNKRMKIDNKCSVLTKSLIDEAKETNQILYDNFVKEDDQLYTNRRLPAVGEEKDSNCDNFSQVKEPYRSGIAKKGKSDNDIIDLDDF
jgi:putative phage-type endonuclease